MGSFEGKTITIDEELEYLNRKKELRRSQRKLLKFIESKKEVKIKYE